MLHLRPASPWTIPVLLTQASAGVGTEEVRDALDAHKAYLANAGERAARDAARREVELVDILDEELRRRVEAGLAGAVDGVGTLVEQVRTGAVDPYSAA